MIDSSVALKWFVPEPDYEAARALLDANKPSYAPDLILAEVTNALWRKVRIGQTSTEQIYTAIAEMNAFLILPPTTASLMQQAFDLAQLLSHSIYDCVFLALAVSLKDALLITADRKFSEKIVLAGMADRVRSLDSAPITIAFQEEALKSILNLYQKSSETLEDVSKLVRRSLGEGDKIGFINTAELAPAFETPSYIRLRRQISQLTPHQAAALIATCWLGRGYDGGNINRLYLQAQHLASEPQAHAPYIISLLSYLEAGIELSRSQQMSPS